MTRPPYPYERTAPWFVAAVALGFVLFAAGLAFGHVAVQLAACWCVLVAWCLAFTTEGVGPLG
jgi:hypothetical protein